MPRFQNTRNRQISIFFEKYGFKQFGPILDMGLDRFHSSYICVGFYESIECRLKVYQWDWEINLLIGPKSAPIMTSSSPVSEISNEDQGWRYLRRYPNANKLLEDFRRMLSKFATNEQQVTVTARVLDACYKEIVNSMRK